MSSGAELQHAVKSGVPNRIALDVLRAMQTCYTIDSFQQSYFVIDSFQQLFDLTAPDFTPLYQQVLALPPLQADQILASDSLITV